MYGKIFESMYDGTLSANWKAMITFQQMIVLADRDGIIDYTPAALARRTGLPVDLVEEGIEYLQQPDKYSRSQEAEGRRIELLDEERPWGWRIVNYAKYRDLSSAADKRAKNRERQSRYRDRQKAQQVVDSNESNADVTPSNAEGVTERYEDATDNAALRVSRHTDVDADADIPPLARAHEAARQAHRMAPADWSPHEDTLKVVREKTGFTDEELDGVIEKFKLTVLRQAVLNFDQRFLVWAVEEWHRQKQRGAPSGGSYPGFEDPYITGLRASNAHD